LNNIFGENYRISTGIGINKAWNAGKVIFSGSTHETINQKYNKIFHPDFLRRNNTILQFTFQQTH